MQEINQGARVSRAGWWKRVGAICAFYAPTVMALSAQSITTLHNFDGTDGADPVAGLVQATDGNLYGTTFAGGPNTSCTDQYTGCGTVFRMTPSGTLTTLYSFCSLADCADGYEPAAGLIQAGDGNLYGTTLGGGTNRSGTVFRITLSGALTTLYDFCSQSDCADGGDPAAPLLQATNGDLYGTTIGGGIYNYQSCGGDCGTIFKISLSGALTTVYSFCSLGGCEDGSGPAGGLIQASDGNFYGTTTAGGAFFGCGPYGCGTVFKMTAAGTLTTLYSFCSQENCVDGDAPAAGLVQATNGDFYGTTVVGGSDRGGTVFKITPQGTLTTLHSFSLQVNPEAPLIQATDGTFYGTTCCGGGPSGTVFGITPTGTLSEFNFTNGGIPYSPVIQDTNGNLYGTASAGGTNGDGTVFALSLGLGPFVETQPTSAKVGKPVNILGTALKGATSVTFNGVATTFTVASPSLITTTVPQGATTGRVQVVTPGGILTSNVKFRVRQ